MNAKLFTGMGLALALGACVSMPQPNAALETAASMTVLIGAQVQLASLDQTT